MEKMALTYDFVETRPTYVRIRCTCCGMLTRLDNLEKDHRLLEQVDTYCGGRYPGSKRGIMRHIFRINKALQQFWINRLIEVLERLGYKIEKAIETPMPYLYEEPREVIEYELQEREESYPYATA